MVSAAFSVWILLAIANSAGAQGTATPKPGESKSPEIAISSGTLTIEKVEVADRFPPGCGKVSPGCSPANPGYAVLAIWLKVREGNASKITDALMTLAGADQRNDVYVLSDDGKRTDSFSGGMINGRHFVAFTPPQSSKNFVLHWGKNAPVPLGKWRVLPNEGTQRRAVLRGVAAPPLVPTVRRIEAGPFREVAQICFLNGMQKELARTCGNMGSSLTKRQLYLETPCRSPFLIQTWLLRSPTLSL